LDRTPQQIAEEDFLYVESRRIEQNYHRIVEERQALLKLLGGRNGVGVNPNAEGAIISVGPNGVTSKASSSGTTTGGGGAGGAASAASSKKKMYGWEFEGNGNGLPEGWAGEGSKRKATAAQGKSQNHSFLFFFSLSF
jgi:DNA methyltransferase 1-associated protein 1